jgi:hypothetical protein
MIDLKFFAFSGWKAHGEGQPSGRRELAENHYSY